MLGYSLNVKKNYTLKDGDRATASVRSLLYVFILKKEDCYKLKWNESYEQKKASCSHSCSSFILPCTAGLATNLEISEFSMLFSGEGFGEWCTGVTFYSEVKLKNFSLQVCCPMHRYPLFVQLLCLTLLVFGNLRYNCSKEQSSLNVYQWLPLWCSPMNIYLEIFILRTWDSNTVCEVCIFCFPAKGRKEISLLQGKMESCLPLGVGFWAGVMDGGVIFSAFLLSHGQNHWSYCTPWATGSCWSGQRECYLMVTVPCQFWRASSLHDVIKRNIFLMNQAVREISCMSQYMIHWFSETSWVALYVQDMVSAVLVLVGGVCKCCAASHGLALFVVTGLSEAELCQTNTEMSRLTLREVIVVVFRSTLSWFCLLCFQHLEKFIFQVFNTQ